MGINWDRGLMAVGAPRIREAIGGWDYGWTYDAPHVYPVPKNTESPDFNNAFVVVHHHPNGYIEAYMHRTHGTAPENIIEKLNAWAKMNTSHAQGTYKAASGRVYNLSGPRGGCSWEQAVWVCFNKGSCTNANVRTAKDGLVDNEWILAADEAESAAWFEGGSCART